MDKRSEQILHQRRYTDEKSTNEKKPSASFVTRDYKLKQ